MGQQAVPSRRPKIIVPDVTRKIGPLLKPDSEL
jgi:hypothetical protein